MKKKRIIVRQNKIANPQAYILNTKPDTLFLQKPSNQSKYIPMKETRQQPQTTYKKCWKEVF